MIGMRLRTRLMVGAVAAVALAGVAATLLFGRLTSDRFLRFTREGDRAAGQPLARATAEVLRASVSPPESVLALATRDTRFSLVFVDRAGAVVTAPGSPLEGATATRSQGGVTLRGETQGPGRSGVIELHLFGGVPVAAGPRTRAGTLYWIAPPEGASADFERERRVGFLADIWRLAAVAATLAALAALAIVLLSTGRLLRPIEALTAAMRRMAAGDLAARVPDRGGDEVAELARGFNAMAEGRERQERLRRDLVNDVAHELRTPLTHLRAQIDAIRDGLHPLDLGALASLDDEVETLTRLVGDLQDLTLSEAGVLRLDLESLEPGALIESACAGVRARARAAGIALEVEPGDVPRVRADAARAQQVLRAVLDNALRHTPSGGRVRLSVRLVGERVELSVSDSGAGIAPEHLALVFERFWRADPSRARATGGAGLGLAIARQLARAQGGDLTAESLPGSGATLRFSLPRE